MIEANKKIMIVDDDLDASRLMKFYLKKVGYDVIMVERGDQAISMFHNLRPSLVILESIIPGINGIDLCQELRQFSQVPIIFVSKKSEETDKVAGLMSGGDDYITKPFGPREFVARVKVQLRRSSQLCKKNRSLKLYQHGLEIDLLERSVRIQGKPVFLSTKEFDVLSLMVKHPNRVFPIDELFELVWGESCYGDTRTLLVHISNLRKKMEMNPANPKYIITVRGQGYRFNAALGKNPAPM